MSYIGNTSTTQAFSPAIDYFSGNGITVSFTLSRPVASVAQVQVNVNNVQQNPSTAFTVNGNTITFTGAPSSGTNNIYVEYTSPITQTIAPGQGTVSSTQLTPTGVTAGTYGSASAIPAITVDSTGRVTSATQNSFSTSTPVDVQTFNSTGTWTKPTGGQTMARIQMWGGGGGGGNFTGGGGGGYNEIVAPLSDVNTQTATVAAGGAGSTTAGSAGGTSSFVIGGVTRYAYGGAGGSSSSYGGRGGSGLATGLANQSGDPAISYEHWIGGKGSGAACTGPGNGSMFGGGGGAGQVLGGPYTSLYGGNGGATSNAGAQPGGGGGQRPGSGSAGTGGAGRIVVTCW